MSDDRTHTADTVAVIERFEDTVAVLLIGLEQQVVDVLRDLLSAGAPPGQ